MRTSDLWLIIFLGLIVLTVSPAVAVIGTQNSKNANDVNFFVNPASGLTSFDYSIKDFTGSGKIFGVDKSFSAIAPKIITATAGTGGSISPSGSVSVVSGRSQTFTIKSNSGYQISKVSVDGVSKGAISSYTFSGVTATHKISAEFALLPKSYIISATAGTGGSISPSGSVSVVSGRSQTFTITPNTEYAISDVIVDGISQGAKTSYTFNNVVSAHTISVTFIKSKTWTFNQLSDWNALPDGWKDDSQLDSSLSGIRNKYRITQIVNGNGPGLQIHTQSNSWDRIKLRSDKTYSTGVYDWRVYVPSDYEVDASSSIGAFLYDPNSKDKNSREVDFEIGYGLVSERSKYKVKSGQLICYMNVQQDDSTGQKLDPFAVALNPGHDYTLRLMLTPDPFTHNYKVQWFLATDNAYFIKQREYYVKYGPDSTKFYAEMSVENFENRWIGKNKPTSDKNAYFRYVTITQT